MSKGRNINQMDGCSGGDIYGSRNFDKAIHEDKMEEPGGASDEVVRAILSIEREISIIKLKVMDTDWLLGDKFEEQKKRIDALERKVGTYGGSISGRIDELSERVSEIDYRMGDINSSINKVRRKTLNDVWKEGAKFEKSLVRALKDSVGLIRVDEELLKHLKHKETNQGKDKQ